MNPKVRTDNSPWHPFQSRCRLLCRRKCRQPLVERALLLQLKWTCIYLNCGFHCNLLKVPLFREVFSSGLKWRNLMLTSLYMSYFSCMVESPSSSNSMESATAFSRWHSRSFLPPGTRSLRWLSSSVSDWKPGCGWGHQRLLAMNDKTFHHDLFERSSVSIKARTSNQTTFVP